MLDEAYGDDVDKRIRGGEAALRDRLLPELEWDHEDSRVVQELVGSFSSAGDDADGINLRGGIRPSEFM